MADNNGQQQQQQQQQQKGGGNNQKGGGAQSGITAGISLNPNDLTPRTLSGMFSIAAVATGAIFAIRWLHPVFSRVVMGVPKEAPRPAVQQHGSASSLNPGDVMNAARALPEGPKKGLVIQTFNTLDDATKQAVLSVIGKTGD